MLKITKTDRGDDAVWVELHGKVADQWAALLEGECRAQLRHGKHVYLECSGVDFVDAKGIEVLRNLPRQSVTLVGATAFVTDSLQREGA